MQPGSRERRSLPLLSSPETHKSRRMDILFLLVPFSVLLALLIVGLLAWAVWSGQFEDVDKEGERILDEHH